MNDTRETLVQNMPNVPRVPADNEDKEDIAFQERPKPRFKMGDILLSAYFDGEFELRSEPFWDYEFSGWMISPGPIGVHESNFILASERSQWEPHRNGLLSYWLRRSTVRTLEWWEMQYRGVDKRREDVAVNCQDILADWRKDRADLEAEIAELRAGANRWISGYSTHPPSPAPPRRYSREY